MDAAGHGRVVLAAILHGRKDLLELALAQLTTTHFVELQQRQMFTLLERYLDHTRRVLTTERVDDLLDGQPPGTAAQFREFMGALAKLTPADGEFRHSVDRLRHLAAERRTGEVFTQGMEILQRGAYIGQGAHREFCRGHEPAIEHALAGLADVHRELRLQEAPEGDMRTEARDIMEEYTRRARDKRKGVGVIQTGLDRLDAALGGGVSPGELVLVMANTGTGKSCFCASWVWHACVVQGKNVVVFTSETSRLQYRNKIIARHSRSTTRWAAQFPDGINTRDLRSGGLDGDGREFLRQTVHHFATTPEHGRCYIAQVPRNATIETIEARLARISRLFVPDLVVIDSLMLLKSARRRQSRREELSDIVQEAQGMSATFYDGRGVPVVSPWQPNREGTKRVTENGGGMYSSGDLGETSEASSAADLIIGLVPDGELRRGRFRDLCLGTPKVRDGERLSAPLRLTVDYATSYFAPRDGEGAASALDALGGLDGELSPV